MGEYERFEIYYAPQIAIGFGWDCEGFMLRLCLMVPFFTMFIGFGKQKD